MKYHRAILKISARHKKSGKSVFLYYYSVAQAKYYNKDFENFRELGFAKDTDINDFMKVQHDQKKLNEYNNIKKRESNTEKMIEKNRESNTLTFSKNKLVLLSKILKDTKNKTVDPDRIKILNIQRRMVESLINGKLDKLIDRFQERLKQLSC